MDDIEIKYFIESALLAAGRPLSVSQLQSLFDTGAEPERSLIRQAISTLNEEYEDRGFSIREVASGFRIQIESDMVERLQKLWEQRPPRYSRAMFETLALIAYRQPMTRGEIEEIRGVSVSANIIRSLLEREWVRVVGHRDVPGRPEMFGTTKEFLDYFGLKKLDDLPPLADLSDWESLRVQLNLPAVEEDEAGPVATEEESANATTADAADAQNNPAMEDVADFTTPFAEEAVDEGGDSALDSDADIAPVPDRGVEPIEVTEWSDSEEGNSEARGPATDAVSDEGDTEEDADASLTGA
ncbi:MAG: SMC-Scp complex subunit ScpB [Woeseiaceae bacterium]|nr:SMC-Scp complex subunit ScpB [Woeseiaceae bacterium]